jgi:hypothetical protein
MVNKQFVPSKTAQNGLNFVTKDEEVFLSTKEQPIEIIYLFKLIYLYLNEPYDAQPDENIINYVINEMENKYNVENLSNLLIMLESLLVNHISSNVEFEKERLDKIISLVKCCPKILSSSDCLKINRSVSYITFILREIYEYATAKTVDGVYVIQLRKAKNEINEMNTKIDYLERLLN